MRELAEFKEETKRKDKESKEREKEREKELMAFQTEQMERMRKMEQNMFELMGKGQPAVAEQSTAPDNDQSEVQPDEMMYTLTPHPPF